MSTTTKKRNATATSFKLPAPTVAWLTEEAARRGLTRNVFAILLFEQAQHQDALFRLDRLERHLRSLETVVSNHLSTHKQP